MDDETGSGNPQPPSPPMLPLPPAASGPWATSASTEATGWNGLPARAGGPAVPGAPGLEFIGAIPRLAAHAIDLVAISITFVALAYILFFVLYAASGSMSVLPVVVVVGVAVDGAYFIGFWRTKATPGMRVFDLQIGHAADGRRLGIGGALRRWVVLGSWLMIVGMAALPIWLPGALALLWSTVLVVTIALSPTRQGLHDRIANTAVVGPAAATSAGAAMNTRAIACVLLIGIVALFVLPVVIAMLLLG